MKRNVSKDSITTVGNLLDEIAQSRAEGFGSEVIRRILIGNYVLCQNTYQDYYSKAIEIRKQINYEYNSLLYQNNIDILLGPTVPLLPFFLSNPPNSSQMLLNDILTVPANLANLSAINIPTAITEISCPISMNNEKGLVKVEADNNTYKHRAHHSGK